VLTDIAQQLVEQVVWQAPPTRVSARRTAFRLEGSWMLRPDVRACVRAAQCVRLPYETRRHSATHVTSCIFSLVSYTAGRFCGATTQEATWEQLHSQLMCLKNLRPELRRPRHP
jgi:hypothetical protein